MHSIELVHPHSHCLYTTHTKFKFIVCFHSCVAIKFLTKFSLKMRPTYLQLGSVQPRPPKIHSCKRSSRALYQPAPRSKIQSTWLTHVRRVGPFHFQKSRISQVKAILKYIMDNSGWCDSSILLHISHDGGLINKRDSLTTCLTIYIFHVLPTGAAYNANHANREDDRNCKSFRRISLSCECLEDPSYFPSQKSWTLLYISDMFYICPS